MSTEATARAFFSAPVFAVVGASSNPAKFGHKSPSPSSPTHPPTHVAPSAQLTLPCTHTVFAWYITRDLPVTPINPGAPTIRALNKEHPTAPSLSALPRPRETAVSLITPPAATLQVLREARELGVPSVWLQPGTYDGEVLRLAREEGAFQNVVVGEGGRGDEGWCVLVDGDRALRQAGKL